MTTPERELLIHDYEKVMKNPDLEARFQAAVAWVLEAETWEERRIRVKFMEDYAAHRLAQLRGWN